MRNFKIGEIIDCSVAMIILKQLVEGFYLLHEKFETIHRNIKLENIMLHSNEINFYRFKEK
jgi:serine/threonine protein kinase